MALKLNVDSLEGIDENHRALYVADGDKFKLAVDGIEDTTVLKDTLRKERKRADDAEKQKKAWERSGKTPEEIQELLEAHEARQLSESERKGEWEKLRTQMNDKHALDLKAKDETIGQMKKRLEAELIDAKAVSAIAAAKGSPDLLLPHVQRHVKVDDDFNVVVVDGKGDPRVNGKGEPLSISDLIEEMKANETFGRAFEGSGHSGSGTRPNSGGGGTPPGQVKSKADLKDRSKRAAFVDAHGHDAYFALPEK